MKVELHCAHHSLNTCVGHYYEAVVSFHPADLQVMWLYVHVLALRAIPLLSAYKISLIHSSSCVYLAVSAVIMQIQSPPVSND